ncbi:MAG TPA: hypothetical protein PKZ69_00770 [Candidatus Cloacimonadota bacterium]|nr:hypothetical protein [Candidatus Cloacimonadota bacterium]
MKKILVLTILTMVVVGLMATNFSVNGDFRTRLSLYKDLGMVLNDLEAGNYVDSRANVTLNAQVDKNLNFVYSLRSGNLVWGGNAGWSNNIDVKTHEAYVNWVCPFTSLNAKAGFMSWADHKSLVLDDEIPVLLLRKDNVAPNLDLEFGYIVLEESQFNAYPRDSDGFLFNVDYKINDDMATGLNTVVHRQKTNAGEQENDFWIMPFFNYANFGFDVDATFALNYGMYERNSGDDVTNMGMAFALDAKYDTKGFGTPGINFLYTSGDDGTDPEKTATFNTLSTYYQNGLEYFGIGIHDGVGTFDPTNSGLGLMSVVLNYTYPVNPRFDVKFAAGMINSIEENYAGETAMGTEIDLGINYKLHDNYMFKLVGAYVMPGDFYGDDLDPVYEISSLLQVKF